MLNVAENEQTSELASQVSLQAAVNAPQSGGMTFTANSYFDTSKAFSALPHTYEAVIKVTDGGSSRTGIILGNFFNGSASRYYNYNFR